MRLKEEFRLQELGEDYLLVGPGSSADGDSADSVSSDGSSTGGGPAAAGGAARPGFARPGRRRVIRFNASAAFLWRSVAGDEFDESRLASLLQAEYGLEAAAAAGDAHRIAAAWLAAGLAD